MAHKHWPKDHPFYELAAVHDMSKSECDLLWRYYQHGHEGVPCTLEVMPGNKTPTCILSMTADELEARRSRRLRTYNEDEMEAPDAD